VSGRKLILLIPVSMDGFARRPSTHGEEHPREQAVLLCSVLEDAGHR
jgi:hypothetical protein